LEKGLLKGGNDMEASNNVAQGNLVNTDADTVQNSGAGTSAGTGVATGAENNTGTTSTTAGTGKKITVAYTKQAEDDKNAAYCFAIKVIEVLGAEKGNYINEIYDGYGADKIVQIKEDKQPLAAIYVELITKKGSEQDKGQTFFQLSLEKEVRNLKYIEKIYKAYTSKGYNNKFLIVGYGTDKLSTIKDYFFSAESDKKDLDKYTNYKTHLTFSFSDIAKSGSNGITFLTPRKINSNIRKVLIKDIITYIKSPNSGLISSLQATTSTNVANHDPIRAKIDAALGISKQIILTGAPGTGKTYSVREYVEEQTTGEKSRYKFVQFHPSYDYSDFVEGLRPVQIGEESASDMSFVRLDGTFKAFCRTIVEKTLECAYEELTL
jgi:hypothetical protein